MIQVYITEACGIDSNACPRCNKLTEWLKSQSITFKETLFTTDVQVEFIMLNNFGEPPILKIDDNIHEPNEFFKDDEEIDECKLRQILNLPSN